MALVRFRRGPFSPPPSASTLYEEQRTEGLVLTEAQSLHAALKRLTATDGFSLSEAQDMVRVSGFNPPDLWSTDINSTLNNSGFNVGEVFPQTGGGAYVLASATGGTGGSRCLQIFVPGSSGSLFYPVGGGWTRRNDVYVRWKFRIPPGMAPAGNFKGIRFHDPTGPGNNGELFSSFDWAFDWDGDQSLLALGLYLGSQPSEEATYGIIPYAENLDDDQQHSIEMHYDRNVAGSLVRVRFWFDGTPIVQPAGPCFAGFYSPTFEHPFASYVDGGPGEPSYIEVARSVVGGTFLEDCTCMETVSSSGPDDAEIFWDDPAASTERIGPT